MPDDLAGQGGIGDIPIVFNTEARRSAEDSERLLQGDKPVVACPNFGGQRQ
jgi:hypothetical protein